MVHWDEVWWQKRLMARTSALVLSSLEWMHVQWLCCARWHCWYANSLWCSRTLAPDFRNHIHLNYFVKNMSVLWTIWINNAQRRSKKNLLNWLIKCGLYYQFSTILWSFLLTLLAHGITLNSILWLKSIDIIYLLSLIITE